MIDSSDAMDQVKDHRGWIKKISNWNENIPLLILINNKEERTFLDLENFVHGLELSKFDRTRRNLIKLSLISLKTQENLNNSIKWFSLLKGSGEPGDNASFLIGSKAKDLSILYEIEHKGKIIKKEWIKISDQQKIIDIPIKEEFRGNVSFSLFFVKFNRSFSVQKNITVPYTNKKLDVTFETFRNRLLPGQQEEWKIRIKDKKYKFELSPLRWYQPHGGGHTGTNFSVEMAQKYNSEFRKINTALYNSITAKGGDDF